MRLAYTMKLRPGKRDAYIDSHRNVWPELIAAAQASGIRNHSVFLQGDTIFLYLEADDPKRALEELGAQKVKQDWDRFMREFLFPDISACEEAFHME
ncbi:MAG TPA: L-rhamnose mutarotase [Bryobacteraceae bacterium]|nr:L-rhamnose mutarotase [Bryobacteraceae bacterium]